MADEILLKSIGKRIFLRRKELLLTQEQLAEKIGVSIQMISNLEQGKKAIRPENLVKICAALNISSDYILTGKKAICDKTALLEKIETLSDKDYKMIEILIDYCHNK